MSDERKRHSREEEPPDLGQLSVAPPPHHLESEQAVLGSMMLDADQIAIVSDIIRRDDFYKEAHGVIYEAIIALSELGQPVDTVTVMNFLEESSMLEKCGGATYLSVCIENCPSPANAETYAVIIKEKSNLRRIIMTCNAGSVEAYSNSGRASELISRLDGLFADIGASEQRSGPISLRDGMAAAMETLERRFADRGNVPGLATGLVDLDRITHGLQPSDLIILAARPSMGKSALAIDIARVIGTHAGRSVPTAIFSLEMGAESLIFRMISAEARIDSNALRDGFINESGWQSIAALAERFATAPLYIFDVPAITVPEIRAKSKRLKKEHGLGFMVVDYLQLISPTSKKGKSSDNIAQQVGEISKGLKALAREMNVPILAISQLSRAVEQRTDKRPVLSDLRDSGAIEQDADLVLFLYRDSYYSGGDTQERHSISSADTPDVTELRIAKHRNGSCGIVKLGFIGRYTTFVNLENNDEYDD